MGVVLLSNSMALAVHVAGPHLCLPHFVTVDRLRIGGPNNSAASSRSAVNALVAQAAE